LGEQRGLAVHEVPAFRERGFGAWEGRRAEEIPIEDLSRFWADPVGFDPPDSEPFAAFRERVLAGWNEILAGDARHSLIITHGGVVRVILGDILGLADQALLLIEVPPACHTRLRIPGGDWRPSLMRHGASDG
jgi:broad specificity phosphatase PhoE